MDIFINSVSMIGACFILKYGSILQPIREKLVKYKYFKELFDCSLCLGFWVGVFFSPFYNQFPLTLGFYSAAICWVADHLMKIISRYAYD
jgi:hypothetical protein